MECYLCGHELGSGAGNGGGERMRPCPNPECGLLVDVTAMDCVCGHRFPPGEARSTAVRNGVVLPLVGAGFWERVLARILDRVVGLVMGPLVATIVVSIGALILKGPEGAAAVVRASKTVNVVGFLMFALADAFGNFGYMVASESMAGASLGKRIMGLRVISIDRSRPTLGGVIRRNLAYFVDSMLFGLVGYLSMKKSPLNRRLGDHWGETVVTYKGYVPGGNAVPESEVAYGIAVALLIHVFVRGVVLITRMA